MRKGDPIVLVRGGREIPGTVLGAEPVDGRVFCSLGAETGWFPLTEIQPAAKSWPPATESKAGARPVP